MLMIERISGALLKWFSATSRFRLDEDPNPPAFFLLGNLIPAWLKCAIWDFKYHRADLNGRSPADALRFITMHCGPATRLLDIGCGAGVFLRELRKSGYNGHYTGFDISRRAINHARLLCDRQADWIVGDIETFNTRETYDIICFIESIYYIPVVKLEPVLRHLSECLTTDGRIVIRIWNQGKHRDHIRELSHWFKGFETEKDSDAIVHITRSQLMAKP